MATITTRSGKGSPLTNTEVDDNFTNLNTDKVEASGDTMTGDLAMSGADITFTDDDKAIFGTGSDLEIYHDGTANKNYINSNSAMVFDGTYSYKIQAADGAEFIECSFAATPAKYSTKLNYISSGTAYTVLETQLNGVKVTGTLNVQGGIEVSGVVDGVDIAAIPSTYVNVSGDTMTGKLTLDADPTSALHAATKSYVDTIAAAGIHYHDPVRVESPTALTVTYDNGTDGVGATLTNSGTLAAIEIDGIALSLNDRVLVYTQTDATQNGIYTVTTVGDGSTAWVLTRATDADSYGASDQDALGEGDAFFVKEGDTGAGELYVMNTSGTITFGTTDITFSQIASTAVYSAGTNLSLDGTTFNLDTSTSLDIPDGNPTLGQGSIRIGNDQDLRLYHFNGNSFIYNYTGNLTIGQSQSGGDVNFYARNSGGTTNGYINLDGATQDLTLSHDGTEKLNVVSTGIDVTGTVEADGVTVDGVDTRAHAMVMANLFG